MNWVVFGVQWLHVLLGIVWFGTVLYNALILFPAVSQLPLGTQRQIGRVISERGFKVIQPVAIAVIVLGFLRGTVFGQINTFERLTTAYGITWLVGLVFAIGAYFWAERVIGPSVERMNAIPEAEALGPDGTPTPVLIGAIDDAKRKSVLELAFFAVIFTCMILMRFGL
jgi:uncharacterized membrane protein